MLTNDSRSYSSDWIQLNPLDNCVVAIKKITKGACIKIGLQEIEVTETIPPGHKIAVCAISESQPVVKYGWPIGIATEAIRPGAWIHSHNLKNDHRVDFVDWIATEQHQPLNVEQVQTFNGYRRPNGKVGTRNYIAVVSTVNCSASVARWSANRFTAERLAGFPNVDGIIAIRHETGCGMAYEGSKHKMLERVLSGIATHANVGAAIFVGLGCEQATVSHLLANPRLIQIENPNRYSQPKNRDGKEMFQTINIQQAGGSRQAIEAIEQAILKLLPQANSIVREPAPLSELCVGLKCGGSDGYSGITANPALGFASDLIVAAGGSTLLGETTEVYGAEHLLMRRARSPQIAQLLQERLEWWKWYTGLFGEEIDHNPSTGNKTGGLTTIAEKSLGAVSKSGNSVLEDVIEYAMPATSKGLTMMDSPGFDPACVTGMMASGANAVVFTTGRGSCFGSKPVPTIKVSTNSLLYRSMPEDMDFDSGRILEGQTIEENGRELLRTIIEVASGQKTKSELQGYGDDEFIPWTVGAVL